MTTSSSKDDMGGTSGSAAATAVAAAGTGTGEPSRLVFLGKGAGYSFDLEDLLRASAEVLGKGSVGTSYKAVLEEGTTVVVKWLKDVAVARREFDAHMEQLGRVEHRSRDLSLLWKASIATASCSTGHGGGEGIYRWVLWIHSPRISDKNLSFFILFL
jgi:hypothetical protein